MVVWSHVASLQHVVFMETVRHHNRIHTPTCELSGAFGGHPVARLVSCPMPPHDVDVAACACACVAASIGDGRVHCFMCPSGQTVIQHHCNSCVVYQLVVRVPHPGMSPCLSLPNNISIVTSPQERMEWIVKLPTVRNIVARTLLAVCNVIGTNRFLLNRCALLCAPNSGPDSPTWRLRPSEGAATWLCA